MKANKVLVTYATMSGSTQEIAEFIAAELNGRGVLAEIRPSRLVNDLTGYSAIVLGAPLYMFRMHRDAVRFLARNRKSLCTLPVAVFSGGLYVSNTEEDQREVRRQLTSELDKFPWLKPVSVLQVGGRFDPSLLRFPYNLIPALKQSPPADLRDWNAIRDWTHSLPDSLALPTGPLTVG